MMMGIGLLDCNTGIGVSFSMHYLLDPSLISEPAYYYAVARCSLKSNAGRGASLIKWALLKPGKETFRRI